MSVCLTHLKGLHGAFRCMYNIYIALYSKAYVRQQRHHGTFKCTSLTQKSVLECQQRLFRMGKLCRIKLALFSCSAMCFSQPLCTKVIEKRDHEVLVFIYHLVKSIMKATKSIKDECTANIGKLANAKWQTTHITLMQMSFLTSPEICQGVINTYHSDPPVSLA